MIEGKANGGYDGAQVFARGEFRNHSAVFRMSFHLRRDDGGEDAGAVFHHGRGGLVARGFDAQDSHLAAEDAHASFYSGGLRISEFDYHLPEELIAQRPLEDRAGARMLVVNRKSGEWEDRAFRDFPAYVAREIASC